MWPFSLEKSLGYLLIFAILITLIFLGYIFIGFFSKKVEVLSPNGGEEMALGEMYKVSWSSRGVDRVGIVLFEGTEPKWIAENIDAKLGEYNWKIYPGQNYGDNYWVSVFEYPWKKGNKIDYSDGAFAIVYSELSGCEALSVQNQWPYLPSDLDKVRRVFITQSSYSGNLEGLEGADRICMSEAVKQGYDGSWHAFIGGDSDADTAVERLKKTSSGQTGVFVEAKQASSLIRGASCHRLLGKDLSAFIEIFSNSSLINKEKLSQEFLTDLDNIWLGRINTKSKKNCIGISSTSAYQPAGEKQSYTSTCQNWTAGGEFVEGYPGSGSFPTCYTTSGSAIKTVGLAGLGIGSLGTGNEKAFTPFEGKKCSESHKLICIEE
ncbi:MAG: hypothetical protein PHI53_00295 [Candidatus Pacebacteria bacterium]|nr:hypothetical protein [Candidatus Paceibacterota bacterium]